MMQVHHNMESCFTIYFPKLTQLSRHTIQEFQLLCVLSQPALNLEPPGRITSLKDEIQAVVANGNRYHDGYGNIDDEYWTMNLHGPRRPYSVKTLRARIKGEHPVKSDVLFLLKGDLFTDPGKEWVDSYLLIDSMARFPAPGLIGSNAKPTFSVLQKWDRYTIFASFSTGLRRIHINKQSASKAPEGTSRDLYPGAWNTTNFLMNDE
jgi:hypothetical protein